MGHVRRAPEREGWLEVLEERERVSLLEKEKSELKPRFCVLKDCWLSIYKTDEDARIGEEALRLLHLDLRGALCDRRRGVERCLELECGALFSVQRHRHSLVMRAESQELIDAWVDDLGRSALWETVLRAAASSGRLKGKKKRKAIARGGGALVAGSVAPSSASSLAQASSPSRAGRLSGLSKRLEPPATLATREEARGYPGDDVTEGSGSDLEDGAMPVTDVPELTFGAAAAPLPPAAMPLPEHRPSESSVPPPHSPGGREGGAGGEHLTTRSVATTPSSEHSGEAKRLDSPSPSPSRSGSSLALGGGGSDEEESEGAGTGSSFVESDEERLDRERAALFRDAFCMRDSDSEDDLADLDSKLGTRDALEERAARVRRVRRCARRREMAFGQPLSWGAGHGYCLGHGRYADESLPKAVSRLKSKGVVQLAAAAEHAVALSSSGGVYTWGAGAYGALGHGDLKNQAYPRLMAFSKNSSPTAQVACGKRHSALLTKDGEVWCWGHGCSGELGQGSRHDQWTPVAVLRQLQGLTVAYVACGLDFTLACTCAGSVYAWGDGGNGRLGTGDTKERLAPARLQALRGVVVVRVACGDAHALAVSEEGGLFGWGAAGAHGQGHGSDALEPARIGGLPSREIVVSAACGGRHSLLLTVRGEVWSWGRGEGYALGHGSKADELVPRAVKALRSYVAIQVACGGSRSAALVRGGDTYMWGGGLAVDGKVFGALVRRQVQQGGGVPDDDMVHAGLLGRLRGGSATAGGGVGGLFERARHDQLPPLLLKAALEGGVPPQRVVELRHQLVHGCRDAGALFALPHALWARACELAGLLLGDERGVGDKEPPVSSAEAIVRLQLALQGAEGHHTSVRAALQAEIGLAEAVVREGLRVAQEHALSSASELRVPQVRPQQPQTQRQRAAMHGEGPELVPGADVREALESAQRRLFGDSTQGAGSKEDSAQRRVAPQLAAVVEIGWQGQEVGASGSRGEGGGGGSAAGGEKGEGDVDVVSIALPRLLDYLKGEVLFVAIGANYSLMLCNREAAARGALVREGVYVSSKMRKKGREEEGKQQERRDAKGRTQGLHAAAAAPGRPLVGANNGSLPIQPKPAGPMGADERQGAPALAHGHGAAALAAVPADPHMAESSASNATTTPRGSETMAAAAASAAAASAGVEARKGGGISGWLMICEVKVGLRLPKSLSGFFGESKREMRWLRQWCVLYGNELSIFNGPQDAVPNRRIDLHGYSVADCTKWTNWVDGSGNEFAKETADHNVPTFEVRATGMVQGDVPMRHLYCRPRDAKDGKTWVAACKRATVLQMVKTNLQPPAPAAPWDARVDWTVPSAESTWAAWKDRGGEEGPAEGLPASAPLKSSRDSQAMPVVPASIGAQVQDMARRLDEANRTIAILNSKLREKGEECERNAVAWELERKRLEGQLALRDNELASSKSSALADGTPSILPLPSGAPLVQRQESATMHTPALQLNQTLHGQSSIRSVFHSGSSGTLVPRTPQAVEGPAGARSLAASDGVASRLGEGRNRIDVHGDIGAEAVH